MRYLTVIVLVIGLALVCFAQSDKDGPTNEKAQKTYKQAVDLLEHHMTGPAFDAFKKADKQDGGHCLGCQRMMVKYGMEFGDWKAAETGGEEMVASASTPRDVAIAHYNLGRVLMNQGIVKRKGELFTRAHEELEKALTALPNFPDAVFVDGQVLGRLKQDDAAKAKFEQFVKMRPEGDLTRQRALRYISDPELARARMAPAFSVTSTDGRRIAMDDLQGKVVLIDFWATWCGPCREALPHMREIAKKFDGQPLVVLSVSLDEDENKWKDFIAKNGMTWPQYFDGGFKGPLATVFGIHAIPQTFTIDADGVLQDQHIGDASIEGKLKKLVSKARELQVAETPKQPESSKPGPAPNQ